MAGRSKLHGRGAGQPDASGTQLGDLIGYRIRRLNTLLTQHSKELSLQVLGLPLAHSRVMYELGMRGPAKPAQIARSAGLERSHVTQATHTLVQQGLISRVADPEDGRGVLLSLTPEGQALLDRGVQASAARRDLLEAALTEHERTTFDQALAKLTAAAERLVAGASQASCPPEPDP